MEGETPPIETRLPLAMPDTLMRVDGVSESLQADIQVVGDRVEHSLGTANSMVSSLRDITSGTIPFFYEYRFTTHSVRIYSKQGSCPNLGCT